MNKIVIITNDNEARVIANDDVEVLLVCSDDPSFWSKPDVKVSPTQVNEYFGESNV
jgi:hypothetical protein